MCHAAVMAACAEIPKSLKCSLVSPECPTSPGIIKLSILGESNNANVLVFSGFPLNSALFGLVT